MISFLVAMDKNHVIGYKNDLPWKLPNDLKFFKEKTINENVIMGSKTYDSIGRPLPKRENIVITTKTTGYPENVKLVHDINELKKWNETNPDKEYFVIGGGNIFKQLIDIADRMYITLIEEEFPGDTYFPKFLESEWNVTSKEQGIRNEANPYEYYYLQYDRK